MTATHHSTTVSRKRRAVGAGLLIVGIGGVVAAALYAASLWTDRSLSPSKRAVTDLAKPLPRLPLPQDYKPLTADDALAENEQLPFSTAPIERAPPLVVPLNASAFVGRRSAIDCLTAAVYYEAAQESLTGKRGVAQVVLNRARHPAFPNSVCGVVYQGSERRTGCQFTFTCDGSLARRPSRVGWDAARQVALAALSGYVEPKVGMATHYHADYVVPYWASSLAKLAKIDRHIFYRWAGGWGRRAAFRQSVSQEQFFDTQPQIEGLTGLDSDVTFASPYAAEAVPPGPRLAADESAGALTSTGGATLPRSEVAPSIKADDTPAKLAVDMAKGKLKVD